MSPRLDERALEVLVVEDDDDTRSVLADVLRDRGFEVQACSTGAEALELLPGHHFDAMVTDQVMPGITGLELVHRVRTVDPSVRCVVLSGYSAPVDADVAWIRKPIGIGALLDALSSLPAP